MQIAVLGTGAVGRTVGGRLVELGHDVRLGSRTADNPAATEWVAEQDGRTGTGRAETFAGAADGAELVVNATGGTVSLQALASVAPADLDGVVLLDLANALDFSAGMPPRVLVDAGDSLGEQIQRAHPQARVVKALNTMGAEVMVHPEIVPGRHNAFLGGDDPAAKDVVRGVLVGFGWPADDVIDLGGIETARGTEQFVTLWLRLWGALDVRAFNIAVVR